MVVEANLAVQSACCVDFEGRGETLGVEVAAEQARHSVGGPERVEHVLGGVEAFVRRNLIRSSQSFRNENILELCNRKPAGI